LNAAQTSVPSRSHGTATWRVFRRAAEALTRLRPLETIVRRRERQSSRRNHEHGSTRHLAMAKPWLPEARPRHHSRGHCSGYWAGLVAVRLDADCSLVGHSGTLSRPRERVGVRASLARTNVRRVSRLARLSPPPSPFPATGRDGGGDRIYRDALRLGAPSHVHDREAASRSPAMHVKTAGPISVATGPGGRRRGAGPLR
jgi:hypothetical protein